MFRSAARSASSIVAFAVLLLASAAFADVTAPPAHQAEEPKPDSSEASGRKIVWQMPVVVESAKLREEDRVGANQQPRWTAHRRFSTTRVYVLPPGYTEFTYWLIPRFERDGSQDLETQYEIEFGLPHRFQLDLYAIAHKNGKEGTLSFDEQKVEVRYALADWGRIWGNPTLYAEWIAVSGGADHIEGKLLLGGGISSGWHWGVNAVYEQEMGGERETERELTAGLSRTMKDGIWSLGIETQYALEDDEETRGDYEKEFQLGPSFQFHPQPRMHIDLVSLFPLDDDSPKAEITALVGWEF